MGLWEVLQADGSWEESSGSLGETSAVQPAAWPGRFYKAQDKKEIKGEGAGPGTGGVGIPVASNLAGRWATCSQRPEILARHPLTSRPCQPPTTTSLPPGYSEHQVFAQAETGWVGVGRGDLLEEEANTIHFATVQCPRVHGRERVRARVLHMGMPPGCNRTPIIAYAGNVGLPSSALRAMERGNLQNRRRRGGP